MSRLLALVVPCLLLVTPAALTASDWPQFLGANRDGKCADPGLNKDWKAKPPAVLWKFTLGDGGQAAPCLADGKVFIIDHKGSDDIVRALDASTGKEVWKFAYADSSKSDHGFAESTPTYEAGKLYTLSREGHLHGLDAKTGTKVWSLSLVKDLQGSPPQWRYAMSPLVDGDNIIVCPGGKGPAVAAVNKVTGKPAWEGPAKEQPGYATPVAATLGGKKQYLIFSGFGLLSVDAGNGAHLWYHPWKTNWDVNAAAPRVLGDTVFITSNYGKGCTLLDLSGGEPKALWQSNKIVSHFSTPVVHEGFIYCTSDAGGLTCLDPKTGQAKWQHAGFQKGGLCAIDGALIVVDGSKGDVALVALSPDGYKDMGHIVKPMAGGGPYWTAPIVAGGKLLVRGPQELVCLDLK